MKKILICLCTCFCVLCISVFGNSMNAQEQDDIEIEFTQESIEQLEFETGENSPYAGQYLTYTVDENNNIVRIDNPIQTRDGELKQIAVYIKRAIVGYIISTVIDGMVVAATCESGAWWVAQAISNVLNRPYTGTTYINCDVYPPNSYEGAMCRQYS